MRRNGGSPLRGSDASSGGPVDSGHGPGGRKPAGGGAARLPGAFETDVVLADGATAHVRPIRPDDGPLLIAFHARQSPAEHLLPLLQPAAAAVRRGGRAPHPRRLRRTASPSWPLRGDELIGVARYDRWRHRAEAEVAFFVDDANHGRGLATRAPRAPRGAGPRGRPHRVHRLGAARQPEDDRRVHPGRLRDGHPLRRRRRRGALRPAADAGRPRRPSTSAPAPRPPRPCGGCCSPRSVAVIGAGRDREHVGHEVLQQPPARRLRGPGVAGQPERPPRRQRPRPYRSILDIPDDVDLAVVAVPADAVAGVVEECGRKQVYGVVILSAGFAEPGPEGDGPRGRGAARRPAPGACAWSGPNCLGRHQHRRRRAPARHLRRRRRPPGTAVAALRVRHARRRDHRAGPRSRARALVVRRPRQPGRRVGQRPPPVLGRRRQPPTSSCCTSRASATRATSAAWPGASPAPSRSWR